MSSKNVLATWIILVMATINGVAQDQPLPIKSIHHDVQFVIKNAGIKVNGTFKQIEAEILFDINNLERSRIITRAVASSIDTGISKRDKHLRSSDYFDSVTYPFLTLTSLSFETDESSTLITGKFLLSIKDISKEVSIPLAYSARSEGGYRISGSLKINRLDFGVGESSWTLADEVYATLTAVVTP